MPTNREFKTYMDKLFGLPCKNEKCWKGICIKTEVENEIVEE